jgi:hypothetical protein
MHFYQEAAISNATQPAADAGHALNAAQCARRGVSRGQRVEQMKETESQLDHAERHRRHWRSGRRTQGAPHTQKSECRRPCDVALRTVAAPTQWSAAGARFAVSGERPGSPVGRGPNCDGQTGAPNATPREAGSSSRTLPGTIHARHARASLVAVRRNVLVRAGRRRL